MKGTRCVHCNEVFDIVCDSLIKANAIYCPFCGKQFHNTSIVYKEEIYYSEQPLEDYSYGDD